MMGSDWVNLIPGPETRRQAREYETAAQAAFARTTSPTFGLSEEAPKVGEIGQMIDGLESGMAAAHEALSMLEADLSLVLRNEIPAPESETPDRAPAQCMLGARLRLRYDEMQSLLKRMQDLRRRIAL